VREHILLFVSVSRSC